MNQAEKELIESKTIHGQKPGSLLEAIVAIALERLKYKYMYQYAILGGRNLRGGLILDFLVFTVPTSTPLFVQGDYWHHQTKDKNARFKMIEAQRVLKSRPAVEIWEHEAPDIDTAITTLRRKL